MRTIEFTVPTEVILEFAEAMIKRNLTNSLTGTTDDGELLIEVEFDKAESDEVDELEEILEKLSSQIDEEEQDNED